MRKYKIGITFNLESDVTDIWANGANQNVIHLFHLFQHSSIVEDVVLVSWGPEKRTTPPEGFMLDGLNLKYAYIEDVIDQLDVLIEGSLIIEPHQVARMHEHGGKVVCYKMGNDFIMDMEYFLFDKKAGRVFNGTLFDAVWMIPQHENTCKSYFSIMYRCSAYVVPAIWSPIFCDKVIKQIKDEHNLTFGYQPDPDKKAKRIASFEANINVVKTCFTPILIAEQAYREQSDKIKNVYMCNTYDKKDQWENGLNYAYNDALYGGYPFIHNSKLIPKGVGYYYDQFDAFEGAKVLLDVIDNHDKHHDEYVKRANEYLDSQLPTNPINIYLYEKEIKRLFS